MPDASRARRASPSGPWRTLFGRGEDGERAAVGGCPTSPALVSSDASVVNCPAAIAVWTMFFSPVEGRRRRKGKAPSVTAANAAATGRRRAYAELAVDDRGGLRSRLSPQAAGRRPLRFLASSRTSAGRARPRSGRRESLRRSGERDRLRRAGHEHAHPNSKPVLIATRLGARPPSARIEAPRGRRRCPGRGGR